MFFEQYSHEPAIAVNRFLRSIPARTIARARSRRTIVAACTRLSVMDAHLAQHAWFGADSYSIADIALYAYTHVADEGGFDLAAFRHVRRWLG